MVYLDDVTEANGPFAMLLGYNPASLHYHPDERGRVTRYNQSAIDEQLAHGAIVAPVPGRRVASVPSIKPPPAACAPASPAPLGPVGDHTVRVRQGWHADPL